MVNAARRPIISPPEAREFFAHDRDWCLQQARRVGPYCHDLINALLSDRILERLRAAQGVLGFSDLSVRNASRPPANALCSMAVLPTAPSRPFSPAVWTGGRNNIHDEASSGVYGQQARFLSDTANWFRANAVVSTRASVTPPFPCPHPRPPTPSIPSLQEISVHERHARTRRPA
jgi:hypothetical protein